MHSKMDQFNQQSLLQNNQQEAPNLSQQRKNKRPYSNNKTNKIIICHNFA